MLATLIKYALKSSIRLCSMRPLFMWALPALSDFFFHQA